MKQCVPVSSFATTFLWWLPPYDDKIKQYEKCVKNRQIANQKARGLGFAGAADPRYAQYLTAINLKRQEENRQKQVEQNAKNLVACRACRQKWIAEHGAPYRPEWEEDDMLILDYTCDSCSRNIDRQGRGNYPH